MKPGDKAAIVCCSNGQPIENKEKLQKLQDTLTEIGRDRVLAGYEREDSAIGSYGRYCAADGYVSESAEADGGISAGFGDFVRNVYKDGKGRLCSCHIGAGESVCRQ